MAANFAKIDEYVSEVLTNSGVMHQTEASLQMFDLPRSSQQISQIDKNASFEILDDPEDSMIEVAPSVLNSSAMEDLSSLENRVH